MDGWIDRWTGRLDEWVGGQFYYRRIWHATPGSTSTSTWLHATINHDFCSAGGCVLKRIKRSDRKVRSEKKEDLIGKVEEKKV